MPFKFAEKLMTMSDESWAQHSNPWSVYTRFTCLPMLCLAIWSREYLGQYSWFLVVVSIFWIWYNPRAFGPPARTDNWASKGTFGERIFLMRDELDIPSHHIQMAKLTSSLSLPGLIGLIYGLVINDPVTIALGNISALLIKSKQ